MTVYHITPSDSVYSSDDFDVIFDKGTAAPDSLIVDLGAYLIATGYQSIGAYLGTAGPWTVTVNGSIFSQGGRALTLEANIAGVSTINVGASGGIGNSAPDALEIRSSVVITNAGTISSTFADAIALLAGATHRVVNSGLISSASGAFAIDEHDSANVKVTDSLVNTGRITGNVDFRLASTGAVVNSGQMDKIVFGDGTNYITNNAKTKAITFGDGANTFTSASPYSYTAEIDSKGDTHDLGSHVTIVNAGEINSINLLSRTNTIALSIFSSVGSILAEGNTNTVTNAGIITAISLTGNQNVLHNSGLIDGGYVGSGGNDQVTNSGTINGPIDLGAGTNSFTNSGTVTGDFVHTDTGFPLFQKDTIVNLKQWTGDIEFGDSIASLTNAGTVTGHVSFENGGTLTNHGEITGSVTFGDIGAHVINTGVIDSDLTLAGDVANSGYIFRVVLTTSTNTLTNSGQIQYVTGGNQNDTIVNTGHIDQVNLGAGDDHYTGSAFAENVSDGAGSDIIHLGGGNDTFNSTGGTGDEDTIYGGAGIDTYLLNFGTDGFSINIDTVKHVEPSFAGLSIEKNTATGATGLDHVFEFENVEGAGGNDVLMGNAGANILDGFNGSDGLFGYGGNDKLFGGDGNDSIVGGAGADQLTGGADNDNFCWEALSDSTVAYAGRDIILDFAHGDKINLSGLDTDLKTPGIQHPTFIYINDAGGTKSAVIATPFTGHAGEVRSYWTVTGETIEVDTSGDGKADMAIDIKDATHQILFTSSDFTF